MLVMFEREEIGRETMGEERGETGARYDGGLAVTCSSYYVVILPSSHNIIHYTLISILHTTYSQAEKHVVKSRIILFSDNIVH